jgi:hypothetical protein
MDMSYIATLADGYNVKVAKIEARRSFSFNHYGGQALAFLAALDYRDSLYRDYDIQPIIPGERRLRINSRSDNGVLSGVSLSVEGLHVYFVVKYYDGDTVNRKRFSIRKLGYKGAFMSACKLRIDTGDLGISLEDLEVQITTLDQYIKIFKMAPDVPLPK